jgi:hypothetical protein
MGSYRSVAKAVNQEAFVQSSSQAKGFSMEKADSMKNVHGGRPTE